MHKFRRSALLPDNGLDKDLNTLFRQPHQTVYQRSRRVLKNCQTANAIKEKDNNRSDDEDRHRLFHKGIRS